MQIDADTQLRLDRVGPPPRATEIGEWQFISARKDYVRRFTIRRWTRDAVVVEVGGTQDSRARIRVKVYLTGVATLTVLQSIWLESTLRKANEVIAGLRHAR